jgi:hypothetical protein
MHVAMTAGVENDALAELLMAIVALLAVRHIEGGHEAGAATWWELVRMGGMLGLVLVTKTTAYAAVPVVLVAVVWRWYGGARTVSPRPMRDLGYRLLASLGPALLIALPWFVRNGSVYGWPDITGLFWHDAVVLGQPRTAEWVTRYGLGGLWHRFAEFSFKSFWGVFGWMGVFVDGRIYTALGLFTGVVAFGLVSLLLSRRLALITVKSGGQQHPLADGIRRRAMLANDQQARKGSTRQLVLLVVWLGWTLLQYLVYNLTFVQHQGRYLFPALIPIGLAFTMGWRAVLRPRPSRWLAVLLAIVAAALALWGLVTGSWHTWPLLLVAAGAAGLFVIQWLPRRLDNLLFGLPFVGLALLDLVSLYAFIVPGLS